MFAVWDGGVVEDISRLVFVQAAQPPEVAWVLGLRVGKEPVTRSLRDKPSLGNSPGGRATCRME